MRIAIGSDHRGYAVKTKVIELLNRLNQEVIDAGPHSNESVDYPDIASIVARQVSQRCIVALRAGADFTCQHGGLLCC